MGGVVCAWHPVDAAFIPTGDRHIDADQATQVARAAAETAERGASLAREAGFRSTSVAIGASPTWRGIVQTTDERDARLLVVGSHRRAGLIGHLHGNFAAAVIGRATSSVTVVHQRRGPVAGP